jgi:hypothetical protein
LSRSWWKNTAVKSGLKANPAKAAHSGFRCRIEPLITSDQSITARKKIAGIAGVFFVLGCSRALSLCGNLLMFHTI